MQDFRKLRCWHAARELAVRVVDSMPEGSARRVPGLRAQAVRAAISVAANLAEGCARSTRPDFLRFVEVALASLNELEAHLLIASDTGALKGKAAERLPREIVLLRRMLISLMRALQQSIAMEESARRHATKN